MIVVHSTVVYLKMEKVFILVILIAVCIFKGIFYHFIFSLLKFHLLFLSTFQSTFGIGSTKKVCIQVGDAMSFAIEAPTDGKLHVNIPYKYKGLPLTASELDDDEPIDLNSMFQCKVKLSTEPNEKILPKYELTKEPNA